MRLPRTLASRIRFIWRASERDDISRCCWEWLGAWGTGNGYANVRWAGKQWKVHRLIWTLLRGCLKHGDVLDHLCRNRRCCTPIDKAT